LVITLVDISTPFTYTSWIASWFGQISTISDMQNVNSVPVAHGAAMNVASE
jgi:hypothetical protein